MIEKLLTLLWFLRRPAFWPHMAALAWRKFDGSARHERRAAEATRWAAERAVPADAALRALGVIGPGQPLSGGLPAGLRDEGARRAAAAGVTMGGAGDIELLHRAILALRARNVLETGVAFGWSSLAALDALEQTGGWLFSVDMPYPKAGTEAFVGVVVPEDLRQHWTLLRLPDRPGIRRAIALAGGDLDLVHYDSDKSYSGRTWAFPILWEALGPGGLFISDDIQDNFGFRDFAERLALPYAVVESDGKHVGLLRKPPKEG